MSTSGKDDGRGSALDQALAGAIDHLLHGGGPGQEEGRSALESRLLTALEMAVRCPRATIWLPPRGHGSGPMGRSDSTPWIHRRSRGPRTPSPAELGGAPWDPGFRAVDAGPLGTVVHVLEPFDDGSREGREDALEALAALAGELLGDPQDTMGGSPLDVTPPIRPAQDEPGEAA